MRYEYKDARRGMTEELEMYYNGSSLTILAKRLGMTKASIAMRLSAERKSLGLRPRPREHKLITEFVKDRDLVMALRVEGLPVTAIAKKWGLSPRYAGKLIKKWTPEIEGEVIQSHMFDINDETLPAEFTITRYGHPVYKVTRL